MKPWFEILIGSVLSFSFTSDKTPANNDSPSFNERLLIITADDFGASENINEGIEIAANQNSITTISALTNFTQSLPRLKKLADMHPHIGIGVHLNITTGKPLLDGGQIASLVDAQGNFYPLEELVLVIDKIALNEVKKELKAQIDALINHEIIVDHLSDQNGVLTFYGPFFDLMLELAVEYKLPVRSPEIAGVKYPDLFPNSKMSKYGRQIAVKLAAHKPLKAIHLIKYSRCPEVEKKVHKLNQYGIPHPDLLVEYFWGDPTESNLKYILQHLPKGTSELILHLGTNNRQEHYPTGLDLEYFRNREHELKIISGDCLTDYCKNLSIDIAGYLSLPGNHK